MTTLETFTVTWLDPLIDHAHRGIRIQTFDVTADSLKHCLPLYTTRDWFFSKVLHAETSYTYTESKINNSSLTTKASSV